MQLINFSHPLTDKQIQEISAAWGGPIDEVINVRVQLDQAAPFERQIEEILHGVSVKSWKQVIVNLPGLAPAAAVLLNQIQRISATDVICVRMKSVSSPTGMIFEFAEFLWL